MALLKWVEMERFLEGRYRSYVASHKINEGFLDFAVQDFAAWARLWEIGEGTAYIEAYQYKQRRNGERGGGVTKFLIHRVEGTRAGKSLWRISVRETTAPAHQIALTFASDIRRRVERAVGPDLKKLNRLNPGAARHADRQIAIIGDALVELENAIRRVNGALPN